MELRRGKTFIKSSLQLTSEKAPLVDEIPTDKDDLGKDKRVAVEGSKSEVVQPASLATHKYDRFSNTTTRSGASENIFVTSGSSYKLVRKSKTHDCVIEVDKTEQCNHSDKAYKEGSSAPGRSKGRLVNSISFSGVGSTLNSSGKKESVVSPSQSTYSSQQMIDYRNFVPQMPFVPAVAKSIPRKRISLKRSKKGLRDIFHMKKNKPESLTLLVEKGKRLPSPAWKSELSGRLGKYLFKPRETFAADCLAQDLSDSEMQSDSSYDYCNALCEDVASLKSFDSLTGCGEIFADESSAHLDLESSKEVLMRRSKHKESPALGSFQGGVEQLASPAQNEAADFAKFWDNINKSVRLHQSTLFDRRLLKIPSPDLGKTKREAAASMTDLLVSPDKDPDSSKESSVDTGTPKSDHQESTSTSDEGYYDSFSPGQDDEMKEAQTPGVPGRFPRDSYSGDALYELFYDPNEAKISPVLDDELCMSESISDQAIEIPLSIYSFHVGAEENMASQPAVDIISQGFLQSTWKGKECLLKLCDTELSLTMGIINWLRKNPGLVSPTDPIRSPELQLEKSGNPLVSCSPSLCQSEHIAAEEEKPTKGETDISNPKSSLVNDNDTVQTCLGGVAEKDQREVSWPHTANGHSQIREGNCPEDSCNVSGLQEANSTSGNGPRSQAIADTLGTCLSEKEKMPVLGECKGPGDKAPLTGNLNMEPACQSSQNPSLNDSQEVESCYSYMTAATSPMDSLETADSNKTIYHSLSISCDKPMQPLTLRHFQSYISPTQRDSDTTIVQLLERCVTQVASLKISYENKHLEDKCIGNEMNNIICKMSQYKNKILLQNECNCITQSLEHPGLPHTNQDNYETSLKASNPYQLKQNKELICSKDQKHRTNILDHMSQVTRSKINFEYAQLNNQALSYIKDFTSEPRPSDSNSMTPLSRPTFLPLFNSVCSAVPNDFSQACTNSSLDKPLQSNESTQCSTTSCSYTEEYHQGLSEGATLPNNPELTTTDRAVTGKNHQ
ncbi:APC membrane recruitment protein 3 [Gopherus evgoodei]|uniref:APC membrane recruitment protein 3 n=1 Tax=Gopherus evgoodei TaxID=1825980 RepID=UPI0011CFBF02|nr:APC membrane recruitment protein 3 [Gopherus evgoodei]